MPPPCTSVLIPAQGTINVDINQTLYWPVSPGAHGYKLTIGTSPSNGSILNHVDLGMVTTYTPTVSFPFNTLLYVTLIPYNGIGDATGCTTISFTTEDDIAPQCTQVIQPESGAIEVAIDATIEWTHAVGNQSGYTISIGTTPQGTDILSSTDIGNVNTYDPAISFPYATTIYVTLIPYWSGDDIGECTSQSFTTIVPTAGDFCSAAIDLPCSVTIEGTTIDAIADPGLPFCTVNIEAPGIWYTFVGDGQNTIISTCAAAGFDTQLNAYKGSCTGLICVAGNNDFCSTSSSITFPTIAGTTYFILVQGKSGQQGTYTLTRTCYDGPFYCMGSGKDASTEWIENVTFAGIENISGSSSYSDYTQTPIIVSRGAIYPIQIAPEFSQNPRNQYFKVWIDFNHDGDFADGGEQVLSVGPTQSSISGNITIPLTAVVSNTRMRVAMRYNTFPGSCATFAFGEVEDYMLSVKCNLVTSTSDSGNGSLRNVSLCIEDEQDVLFAPSLNGQIINVTTGPITVDGQWKWMSTPGSNIQIKAGNISRLLTIPVGKTVEIQHLKLQGGTASQGSAIDNEGTLILSNCEIRPATSSTSSPIFNKGIINIFGVCDIRF